MYRIISGVHLLCFLAISAVCQAATFNDCGSILGKFTSISVSGCAASQATCDLERGTNATISIDFTTEKDVSQVTARVHGVIMDVPVPFPIPKANACENPDSGITCPLKKGGPYHYETTLEVMKAYPKVSVHVKWELINENKEVIICTMIPAKIK